MSKAAHWKGNGCATVTVCMWEGEKIAGAI